LLKLAVITRKRQPERPLSSSGLRASGVRFGPVADIHAAASAFDPKATLASVRF